MAEERSASESISGCQMAFSASKMSFYSSCTCEDIPTMTNDACSLSGFSFKKERDGPTPFAPGFPASSPWVTAVGATQVLPPLYAHDGVLGSPPSLCESY